MHLEKNYDPAWYPPGHGDMYRCLYESGLLGKFIKEGKKWAFVSNIDNLGATTDLSEFKKTLRSYYAAKASPSVISSTGDLSVSLNVNEDMW